MNYQLYFPTNFNNINPTDDNIDVFMELPDGKQYTFVVATPQNLQQLIQINKKPYLEPGSPLLFVDKLTEENIRLLFDELVKNPILLRIYGEDF